LSRNEQKERILKDQNGYPHCMRWNSKTTQELEVKKGGYPAGWRNNQTSL